MPNTKRIFVSNRLPFNVDSKTGEIQRGSGGLVSALMGVSLDEPFSWVGFETSVKNANILLKKAPLIAPNLQCRPVLLEKDLYEKYYDGFSNDTIWPLFHYEGHLVNFQRENWNAYVEANRRMADEIAKIASPNDTVWIHDFHFLMLPKFLREKCPQVKIGFFLHIPFPSAEVFRQLPVRHEIMESLAQCDLIGFHEHSYLRQFIVALKLIAGVESSFFKADVGDHTLRMGVYPISIDSESFMQKARSDEVATLTNQYHALSQVPFVILGVDRLDYTKGLELKLRGFQRALKKYPELVGKISFLQVAVPTRQKVPYYAKIKRDIDQLVGSINGEFAKPHYTPVNYIFNSVQETQLLSLYRSANVALVTSKRDGMNLVAMEYIMAQDIETPGVLILSEFAGAASFLADALIINPWDVDEIADAIYRAFTMPVEERAERLGNMQTIMARYSATKWAQGFLNDLDEAEKDRKLAVSYLPTQRAAWPEGFVRKLEAQPKIRLVLDYDGTLVPLNRKPERAILMANMQEMLRQLQHRMDVYIISGRSRRFLENQLGNLDKVYLVAEHGAFVKAPNGEWQSRVSSDVQFWYPQVEKVMKDYAERVPLSAVELKETSLVWHYRESPTDFAEFQAKKLDEELQTALANAPVVVMAGSKIVEAKAIECNKGNFLRSIMLEPEDASFYICLGDDRTDEDMFRVVGDRGIAIKIGLGATTAQYRLHSQAEVLKFFNQLELFLEEHPKPAAEEAVEYVSSSS